MWENIYIYRHTEQIVDENVGPPSTTTAQHWPIIGSMATHIQNWKKQIYVQDCKQYKMVLGNV